jgi:DNA-binding transcriptional MerR regulator
VSVAAPTRRPLDVSIAPTPPRVQSRLSTSELADAAGISEPRLTRLVRLGLVEPEATGWFTAATAARLRRMLRLHRDLGVTLVGAAIVVDLLERIDRLERELTRTRGSR